VQCTIIREPLTPTPHLRRDQTKGRLRTSKASASCCGSDFRLGPPNGTTRLAFSIAEALNPTNSGAHEQEGPHRCASSASLQAAQIPISWRYTPKVRSARITIHEPHPSNWTGLTSKKAHTAKCGPSAAPSSGQELAPLVQACAHPDNDFLAAPIKLDRPTSKKAHTARKV
jgi:hypothetical protein